MIEQLELQLARLWRLAKDSGHEAAILDSVKRHHRIRLQKPEIGELALSIASIEAAIAKHKEAIKRGQKVMEQQEYGEAVQHMVEIGQRRNEQAQKEQSDEQRQGGGDAGGESPGQGERAEPAAGGGAGEAGAAGA